MIAEAMIAQLRVNAAIFAGRVAGAADFKLGLENYNSALKQPAAYVVPLGIETAGNENLVGIFLRTYRVYAVIAELDATADRRAQEASSHYDEIETDVFHSLLGYNPDPCHMVRGLWLSGGHFLDLDRARLFYQWEFMAEQQFTQADGVDTDINDPTITELCSIEVDIFKAPTDFTGPPAAKVVIDTDPDNLCNGGTVDADHASQTG